MIGLFHKHVNLFISIIFISTLFIFISPPLSFAEYKPAEVKNSVGTGEIGVTNGELDAATFRFPTNAIEAPDGSIYISDTQNHLIRKWDKEGNISTIAGYVGETDVYGMPKGGYKDGKAAEASFAHPKGLALDNNNHLYVVDSKNNAIRKVSLKEMKVTTVVKGLNQPSDIVIDSKGRLIVSDTMNHRIIAINEEGQVEVLAGGNYEEDSYGLIGGLKDGIGLDAKFNEPTGLAIDNSGNVYVADSGNQRIRKVSPSGVVTTIAGSGNEKIAGTIYLQGGYVDGSALEAKFNFPNGLAVQNNIIFVADSFNHVIRVILPNGMVETVAGTGESGRTNGVETKSSFSRPTDVIVLANDQLLVVDQWNQLLRKIVWYDYPKLEKGEYVKVLIENQLVEFDEVKPKLVNGRTMVPIRFLSNALGYQVSWNQSEQMVTIKKDKESIHLKIGEKEITGARQLTTDIAPYVDSGRTLVSLRFVNEAFGYKVNWLRDSWTVLIRK